MATVQFDPNLRSNARVHVKAQKAPDGELTFTLSKPSKGAFIGRGALNLVSHLFCFIPGVKYNKNWRNPSEWSAFRNAVMASHAKDIREGKLSEDQLKQILDTSFSTYSQHKRLTQGKAAAVLDDVRRAIEGKPLEPRKPNRLNASQAAIGRGLRSIWVQIRGRNADMQALRTKYPASDNQTTEAIRDILQPGKKILSTSVKQGHYALEKIAKGRANFDWLSRGMDSASLNLKLGELGDDERKKINTLRQQARSDPTKPAILSVPLILDPKTMSLHERHVVELAVDFRSGKLLYLDSKGESIEEATANYDAGDVKQALENFGKEIFGGTFNPASDIVQMTQAKQQGANDCGAFTHDFAHRLIEGQSVGDIERSFTADDRAALRLNMARQIEAQLVESAGEASDAGSAQIPLAAGHGSAKLSGKDEFPEAGDESFDMMSDEGIKKS